MFAAPWPVGQTPRGCKIPASMAKGEWKAAESTLVRPEADVTRSEVQLREFTRGALDQNRRWLTAYFLSVTGDFDHSQDLVQEVFVRALRAASTYDRTQGTLGGWLRGIARNVLSEHCRQAGRDPLRISDTMLAQLEARAAHAETQHTEPDHQTRRLELLHECLDRLTDRARRMFQMKYQQRSRSQQIAEAMGMNENAVNVALCRGRRILQECIEQKVRESHA